MQLFDSLRDRFDAVRVTPCVERHCPRDVVFIGSLPTARPHLPEPFTEEGLP